jgi:hypothetical protein
MHYMLGCGGDLGDHTDPGSRCFWDWMQYNNSLDPVAAA